MNPYGGTVKRVSMSAIASIFNAISGKKKPKLVVNNFGLVLTTFR